MPRYAPRSSFRTRPSADEHPEGGDFAATALNRVVVDVDLAEQARRSLRASRSRVDLQGPETNAAKETTPAPSHRWRALLWAPVVFLVAIALGAMMGSMVAALGL